MIDTKCYFVKLMSLYSTRLLYGYKCDLESLYSDIIEAKRFYIIEQNITDCKLYGDIIDDLNKFKRKLNTNYSSYCRDC
jgi:hypothetical protein